MFLIYLYLTLAKSVKIIGETILRYHILFLEKPYSENGETTF